MILCVGIRFMMFSPYNFKNKTDETTILLFKLIAFKLMTLFGKKNVVLQTFQLNKNMFLTDVSFIERSQKILFPFFRKDSKLCKT